jgi:hypothetical protein
MKGNGVCGDTLRQASVRVVSGSYQGARAECFLRLMGPDTRTDTQIHLGIRTEQGKGPWFFQVDVIADQDWMKYLMAQPQFCQIRSLDQDWNKIGILSFLKRAR